MVLVNTHVLSLALLLLTQSVLCSVRQVKGGIDFKAGLVHHDEAGNEGWFGLG